MCDVCTRVCVSVSGVYVSAMCPFQACGHYIVYMCVGIVAVYECEHTHVPIHSYEVVDISMLYYTTLLKSTYGKRSSVYELNTLDPQIFNELMFRDELNRSTRSLVPHRHIRPQIYYGMNAIYSKHASIIYTG